MIRNQLIELLNKVVSDLSLPENFSYTLNYPPYLKMGDYTTNLALIADKYLEKSSKEIAEEIINSPTIKDSILIEKVEIAGPGFVNFFISKKIIGEKIKEVLDKKDSYGKSDFLAGQKMIFEYTDPNPFKHFHIGHLMANTVGETLSRLAEWNGAEVKRLCYQGDTGIHVAQTIWGILKDKENFPNENVDLLERITFLNKAYAFGNKSYLEDEKNAEEIKNINKSIFEKSDDEINNYYEIGRKWSLEYFDLMYEKLGTKFDQFFYESEVGPKGAEIVNKNIGKVFDESDGAVIFDGESRGLHTRVFINSQGLPTYEAKELGLAFTKKEIFDYDKSVIVTGNEVKSYFQVLLKAISEIDSSISNNTEHISHGMLKLPEGKMSSRTGNVITASELINDLKAEVKTKIKDIKDEDIDKIAEIVSIGSIKYSILRQSIGHDVVFDKNQSISFEGDSGAYVQYTYVRAQSVLNKASNFDFTEGQSEGLEIERLINRFEEIVIDSYKTNSPQKIIQYITELSSSFNSFYASNKISGNNHYLSITKTVAQILKNGLDILGIKVPEKM